MTNPTPHGQVPEALRFTKKPVTIEAIQWTGKNLREVITFTDGPPDTRSHHAGMAWEAYADLVARDGLMIYTLEDGPDRRAKHFADIGDWIIRGVKGEYYPCKPDIFEATYERAAHVQNPAEIEHVANDVSKNGAESNMGVAYAEPSEFPAGAIVNGRTHIDRLESFYRFDCEAGPLINCDDWHGLKRCFEHLAERASHGQAPAGAAEPVAYLHDDGYWTPAKTDEGRKLNDRLHFAGSPKVGVHLAPTAQPAPATQQAWEVDNLRKALQFYANGEHFIKSDDTAWDTVSGEPQNYWCDEAGTATVEDGSIARLALAGHQIKFEDEEPQPSPTAQEAPVEWDGKLPTSLQRCLNALRLECPPAVVNGVEHEVRSTFEALHTTLATTKRMYGAARDRLEAVEAAQAAPAAPHPIARDVAADLERSDWTPEEALRWYAAGKHYDTVPNGDGSSSARILDNGAVASNALKSLSRDYAEHKGDVALMAAPAADRTVSHKAQALPGVEWQCGPQASGLTAQAGESQPAVGYPPLPRVGAIGYASVVDIDSYAKTLTIGPHLPGVRDIALWTTDQMRAYVDADRAASAPAESVGRDAPAAGAVAGPDGIDAIALTRYKVVPSHDSMFHRFAVVAGDGKQQLYLGRETECQNMARKFAGAFLDGAFYQSQIAAAPTPAAQQGDAPQRWAPPRYTAQQRDWCVAYEAETSFDPMMDDYEAGLQTFAEAAVSSLRWYEDHTTDAHLRISSKVIPGGPYDAAPAQKEGGK